MSGILVIAEARRGELRDVTFEVLGAATALAAAGCTPLRVCVIGDDPSAHAAALGAAGVEEVLTVTVANREFEAHVQAEAVKAVIAATEPAVVLTGHTIDTMGYAPAVAVELGLGFATDAIALRWDRSALTVERGDYSDRLVATVDFPGHATTLVTVRPGSATAVAPGDGAVAARDAGVTIDPSIAATEHVGYVDVEAGDVDISKADFLLSIGRGVEDEEEVERFEDIAKRIGATLSASRPLIDAGWLPAARQVGQSGQTVKPKVYLALGISGAVQHLIGMKGAETIIAVNTDPEAPIFKIAQYGAVADLTDVAQALTEHLGAG
jgi:electron transfer flavoprotein alpha subunit